MMLWNTFERDKEELAKEFTEVKWSTESGLSLQALKAECSRLAEQSAYLPRNIVKANIFAYIVRNARISIHPLQWFADQLCGGSIVCDLRNDWSKEAYQSLLDSQEPRLKDAESCCAMSGGEDYSHASPDWGFLMEKGIVGALRRIEEEKDKKTANGTLSETQKNFYESCHITYTAIIDFLLRLSEEAKRLSADNLRMAIVSENLTHLTQRAPQTLLEAMQLTVVVFTLLSNVENVYVRSLGRLDTLYLPFYKADLASGRFTKKQMKEILQYFLYRFYAANIGANLPFSLCGTDQNGNDATNELSYLILEAYGELNILSPKIHICCNKNIPDKILKKTLEIIKNGNTSFVFANDEIIVKALMKLGETEKDARNYVMIGCYEPTSMGKEVPCTCNGRLNLPKMIEYALTNGVDLMTDQQIGLATGGDFEDFDHFYEAIKNQISFFINAIIWKVTEIERKYPETNPSPMFSGTFSECMERGLDAYEGGAKYNNSSINAIGLATAVDSLLVIKNIVFDEKLLTLSELRDILKSNWIGFEKYRFKFKNHYPKFGNNANEADILANDLVKVVSSFINGKPNGRNGVFRCGFFSIDWRIELGSKTGASADGRMAGDPLSKNIGASTAQDKEGVTALIESAIKIDYTDIPNGTVLDILLHPSAVLGEAGSNAMLNIVKTFLQYGGLAIQCNIFNPAILKRAQKQPENYATLQVRLCGWNVYFVDLSKLEQDEFIRQAENNAG